MIKKIFVLLILLSHVLYAFQDVELEELWSSIEDMTNPTIDEYQKIETYLKYGDRPYLAPLANHDRMVRIRDLQLIGPNQEKPLFEKHSFNIDEKSDKRCIVLFASYNGIYPAKARKLLSELEECGYSGHVLLRIGGFPNLENGGLKLCYIPYAFKVAFLIEALQKGYKEVLWIDTAMHPLTNLEKVFSIIKEKGYFFTSVGFLSDNQSTHLPDAATALGLSTDSYDRIPHLSSSILGLNMENSQAIQLLKKWYAATENVYPYMTCWPEELSLSVMAWRLQCRPYSWFGQCVCGEHELQMPIVRERPLQFYIDPIR
jgi:hypothetical protein